jgi:hypothetical protein
MMLLGEISELSLEPAIEGRFDASICIVPSGVAKKYVDTFLEAPITSKEPAAVLSGQARTVRGTGPDGPRPGAGARVPCLTAGRSARAQGRRMIAGSAWISLPGGTPSGRRDPRSCLGSGRPT